MENNKNIMRVVELGLQTRVLEAMKEPGFSPNKLSATLQKENIDLSAHSIRKFIKNTKEAQRELISRDLHQANELVKITMDYNKALKDILKEVEEVKNEAKTEKDYVTYNQLVGRILQGIELIAKLTGDIKPKGSVDIKIIYNEISRDIENDMKEVKKNMFSEDNIIDIDYIIIEEDKKEENKIKNQKS